MDWVAMEEATEGIHDLTSSVSSPLRSFIDSLNASTEEVQLLLSNSGAWIDELEAGMLLRLDAFDSTYRRANEHWRGRCSIPIVQRLYETKGVLLTLTDKQNNACLPCRLHVCFRRFFCWKTVRSRAEIVSWGGVQSSTSSRNGCNSRALSS